MTQETAADTDSVAADGVDVLVDTDEGEYGDVVYAWVAGADIGAEPAICE